MRSVAVHHVTITSTYRAPEDQARVMFDALLARDAQGKSAGSMYRGTGQEVETIGRVYIQDVKKGLQTGFDPNKPLPNPTRTRASMAGAIVALEGQFGVGCVSRHQLSSDSLNVFDLAETSVSPSGKADELIEALTSCSMIQRVGIPKGKQQYSPKHFIETAACIHIEMLQPVEASSRMQTFV
jgi:hypothetical protein